MWNNEINAINSLCETMIPIMFWPLFLVISSWNVGTLDQNA